MAERKGQDGQRFEDTPSLNIAMGEWGSEVHRSLHDVLFRVTHVLKFFVWRVVDSAIQACGGVRGTLGRMSNGALNRYIASKDLTTSLGIALGFCLERGSQQSSYYAPVVHALGAASCIGPPSVSA